MSCRKIEKYLYLYRDGELNADEIKFLQQHLNRCEQCRKIYDTLQQHPLHTFIRTQVDEMRPELSLNPEVVLNRVPFQKRKPLHRAVESLQDTIRDWLIRPRVQLAWAGLTLLFIITLVGQQLHFASKLTQLEQQMTVVSQNQISREVLSTIPTTLFQDSGLDIQQVQNLLVKYQSEINTSSSITLDGDELKTLILIYQKLKVQNRMLAITLQSAFPEIEEYQWKGDAIRKITVHRKQIEKLARAL